MPNRIRLFLILAITFTFVVIVLPIVPLGITSRQSDGSAVVEWVWSRHASYSDIADFLDRILWPVFAAGCLIAVARMGFKRISKHSTKSQIISYGLLLIASGHWTLAVQQSAPSPHKELKPLWVLYDPGASGYFYEATFDIKDTNVFLKTYEAKMEEGDVLHVGTHPPGMFLLAKGCIELCRSVPSIQTIVESLTSNSLVEAFRYVEQNARLQRSLTPVELAGLELLSLVTLMLATMTLIPLCLLANRFFSPTIAWMLCCLWPTIPTIAVFFPKSDVIFPLVSVLLLLLAVIAAQTTKKAFVIGMVAGSILLLTVCLSLAILPTVAAIGVFLIFQILKNPKQNLAPATTLMATVTVTVAALMIAIQTLFDCNLVVVFQHNLTNHAGFYQQFQRTYWKWLLVNPTELAFAVGLPIAGFATMSVIRFIIKPRQHQTVCGEQEPDLQEPDLQTPTPQSTTFNRQVHSMPAAIVITILLLWLSGKNNGEAARLWCFMTPWVLLLSGASIQQLCKSISPAQTSKVFTGLLICQLLLCYATVSRVNGFSF